MSSKIYKITNLVNGKIYVGYTKNSLEERFKAHCYRASGHTEVNMPIVKAIRQYGKENFKIELLEESEDDEYIHNEREKYWIDTLNSKDIAIGYNIARGGDGGDTYTNNPNKKEILLKNSEILKGHRVYYNPETNEATRVLKGKEPPEGWVRGLPREWAQKCNSREGLPPANKNTVWSDEKKKEISNKTQIAMDNIPRLKCPYCGKEVIECNYDKHVARCKMNPNPITPKYYIMKITNTKTNKIFIDYHIDYTNGIDCKLSSDPYFKNALSRFDRNVFKKEVIEYCTKENAKERKLYWINFYKSYDSSIGFNQKPSVNL